MKFAVACCGTLLLLSSCAKERKLEETPERSTHRMLLGSVESNVLKVQNESNASDCDAKYRNIQIEIAQELGRREAEIAALPASDDGGTSGKKISIGSMTLIERNKLPVSAHGWSSEQAGWADIITAYEKIKGTPTDSAWRKLNSFVRGLVVDDVDRVVNKYNYGLDKDSEAGLTAFRDALAKCESDAECGDPDLSSAASFLSGQPYYDADIAAIKQQTEKAKKRELVSLLLRLVKADLALYSYVKNELLFRQDSDTFVLPLDAGSFFGLTAEIQTYIETAWASAAGKKIKVEWRNSASSPMIFRFLYRPDIGERAYVFRKDRTINLFPNSSNLTIAHEIGHVIGFKDTYFTVWDPKTCSYITQFRDEDLMSSSVSGSVLPEHWQKLEQEYPLTTR